MDDHTKAEALRIAYDILQRRKQAFTERDLGEIAASIVKALNKEMASG